MIPEWADETYPTNPNLKRALTLGLGGGWEPEKATPHSDGCPDAAIVPYVNRLREFGICTLQSCTGHALEGDLRRNGQLVWADGSRVAVKVLTESNAIDSVRKEYKRYPVPSWEVSFPGLSSSQKDFEDSMHDICRSLGVGYP